MARVDEYTREVFLERANPSNIDASGGVFMSKARDAQLDSQRFRERGAAAADWGQTVQRQRDVQGELNARERYNIYKRQQIEWQQQKQNERMTNPDGFADEFDAWHVQSAQEIEDEILGGDTAKPFDLTAFRQLMDNDRTQTLSQNKDWENGKRLRNITTGLEQNLDAMNANFSLSNPNLKDLKRHIDQQRAYVTTTGAKVLDPTQMQRLFEYGNDKATRIVFENMKTNDPKKLRNILNYGSATKDQLIDFVFDIEGQDKIAQEPDGAIAKYGINSKHNNMTHEQVKALTADQARAIYKQKYWDPRLDKMDPAFRAVAFDAIVNHGNDKDTWKMISDADGNPYALMQKRKEKYDGLVSSNPQKYAVYKKGWDARLQELSTYIASQEEGGQEFLQYASIINPDIIMDAQSQIPAAISAKQREQEAATQKVVSEYNVWKKSALEEMASSPEGVPIEKMDIGQQLSVNTGIEEVAQDYETMQQLNSYAKNLRLMTPEMLDQQRRAISGAFNRGEMPNGKAMIDLIDKVKATVEDGIKNEGIAYYGRTGYIRMPQPIDYSNPDLAVTELRAREQSLMSVQKQTGRSLPILAPDEIRILQENIKKMPSDQAAGLLGYYAALDADTKGTLSAAIAEASPNIATAINTDDIVARRRILEGDRILESEKPTIDQEGLKTAVRDIVAPMTMNTRFIGEAQKAVTSYYVSAARERGVSLDAGVDAEILDEAITKIYGPRVDISLGATNEIFSFKDATGEYVSEDDLYDAFNDLTDEDLVAMNGKKIRGSIFSEDVSAQDIRDNAKIISSGSGIYNIAFQVGDETTLLYDKDTGRPVEISGRLLLKNWKKRGKKDHNRKSFADDFQRRTSGMGM